MLYRKGQDGLLLRCVGPDEYYQLMSLVHEGIRGAHQSGIKMRWLIRRHECYWPTILKDCIRYAKGCKACQRHGPIQRAPAAELHPIIKPWPFRGWAFKSSPSSTETDRGSERKESKGVTVGFRKRKDPPSIPFLPQGKTSDFQYFLSVKRFEIGGNL